MQRVDAPEILDSDACSPADVEASMLDMGRVNRWFGGVATTQKMVGRAVQVSGAKRLSLLEVAAGAGEVPEAVRHRLARQGITLDVALLDWAWSHLAVNNRTRHRTPESRRVVSDALALPFADDAFDLISCSLFAHHLDAQQLAIFVREALRVSRRAVLINDLIRHPLHLALAYAGFPLMRSRIAWLDGLTSVRRAYTPKEIKDHISCAFAPKTVQIEISRNYLFRMGLIVWKNS